jgi:hypothetical protein
LRDAAQLAKRLEAADEVAQVFVFHLVLIKAAACREVKARQAIAAQDRLSILPALASVRWRAKV